MAAAISAPIPAASITPGVRARTATARCRSRRPPISSAFTSIPSFSRRTSSPRWYAHSAPITFVLGTDYPYDMAEYDPLGHIAAVEDFDAATVAALAGGNAKKLLGL